MFSNIFNQTQPKKPSSVHYEQSEFDNTQHMLESIVELDSEYFDIMREQLVTLHYGGVDYNEEILTEGFKDFTQSIGNWFAKVIEKFKELVSKAVMYISAYLGNMDKFVKKYRTVILNADPSFSIKGYVFSFPEDDSMAPIEELLSEFNAISKDPSKITRDQITQMRIEKLSHENLNRLRGRYLNLDRPVTQEEYLTELKRKFRSGQEEPVDIEVTKSVLGQAVEDITWASKELKEVNKHKRKMIIYLETLKESFKKGARIQYQGGDKVIAIKQYDKDKTTNNLHPHKAGLEGLMKAYHSFMFDYARTNVNMYLPVINERINALKACLKQSQEIIRKALPYKEQPKETTK